MTNFTKLFCAATLCMGATSVYAQDDEVFDFDETFYHQWSDAEAGATDNAQPAKGLYIMNGKKIVVR